MVDSEALGVLAAAGDGPPAVGTSGDAVCGGGGGCGDAGDDDGGLAEEPGHRSCFFVSRKCLRSEREAICSLSSRLAMSCRQSRYPLATRRDVFVLESL